MNQEAIISDTISFGERTVEVRKEHLKMVLSTLKKQFEVLMDCTGVDYILPEKRTKVMYWLHNPTTYARIRIIVYVPRDGSLPSVTDLWEGADWYERELFDLFGVQFEGHPDLKRILLPDDWVGHPLRRDYSLHDVAVEFKHGIQPKKPAEIIPDVRK